jgi:hypothetical protein
MKANYETLDAYLDALDVIKERVAEDTQGMTAKQVKAYFARAVQGLQQATGTRVRVRRTSRTGPQAKR